MNCVDILIETGFSSKRAREHAPALALALKKRGVGEEEEEPKKKKTKRVLESKDVTEPKNTYSGGDKK